MQAFADKLIQLLEHDPATWEYTQIFYAGVMLAFICLLFFVLVLPLFAGISTWLERKVSARMQSRIGPNRAGPHGFFVWIADGVKLFLKEDLIPAEADHLLFRLGPHLVMVGLCASVVVLPFAAGSTIADMNLALFYLMAVTSIEVVGILVSGWASNSKWSLLGGFRSAAQIISYEIPVALTFMVVALSAGTLSLGGIVAAQGPWPWEWYLVHSPMHFVAFFLYATAALAEGNRTPFDLPEAESELVSGFNTEYSGFRFSAFFMAEFANIWIMNIVGVVLFFGGWQLPFLNDRFTAPIIADGAFDGWALVWTFVSLLVLLAKVSVGVFVVLWLRWTLPRLRIDQMMALCWKYLVPVGILLVILTAAWELVLYEVPSLKWMFPGLLTLVSAGLLFAFLRQTYRNFELSGDTPSLENF
ncbi:MAG: NADH-quinone oxidoreductase subunit H [Deltaproteobacteria bacterium]|nr:NADH-quinone oxidoreductase subunit H [Deltaproteobacteria bacterium]